MRTISGSGARSRKRSRRQLTTAAKIEQAYASASRQLRPGAPTTLPGDVKVLDDTIAHDRGCVFFVAYDKASRRPYEATRMCQGGRKWYGLPGVVDKATALENVRHLMRVRRRA